MHPFPSTLSSLFVVNPRLFLDCRMLSLALFFVTGSLIYTLGWLVPVTWPTNLSCVVSSE